MTTLTVSQARTRLFRLVNVGCAAHEPVAIQGRRGRAVLVSAEDWASIQETLHLLSVKGMRESLLKGRKTPISKCAKKLPW